MSLRGGGVPGGWLGVQVVPSQWASQPCRPSSPHAQMSVALLPQRFFSETMLERLVVTACQPKAPPSEEPASPEPPSGLTLAASPAAPPLIPPLLPELLPPPPLLPAPAPLLPPLLLPLLPLLAPLPLPPAPLLLPLEPLEPLPPPLAPPSAEPAGDVPPEELSELSHPRTSVQGSSSAANTGRIVIFHLAALDRERIRLIEVRMAKKDPLEVVRTVYMAPTAAH
jgi:hypothetical protein